MDSISIRSFYTHTKKVEIGSFTGINARIRIRNRIQIRYPDGWIRIRPKRPGSNRIRKTASIRKLVKQNQFTLICILQYIYCTQLALKCSIRANRFSLSLCFQSNSTFTAAPAFLMKIYIQIGNGHAQKTFTQ
jgi:hypothetical protein